VLFAGSLRRKAEVLGVFPQSKVFPIPPTFADILWNRLHVLPIEKLIGQVDVLHTSDWAEPPSTAFKVTTVHDLAPFLYPNLFPKDMIRNIVDTHRSKLALVRQETYRVIVPTQATKSDLIKLGFSESKIRVIPEAASSQFTRSSTTDIAGIKSKYKLHAKYILGVGMDPRKNTDRIIKAFEHASAGKDVKLVFVGQPKYMKIKENRNIRILGQVPTQDLPVLYSGAEALIYPSLYEGFGLPILEAMSCGCPVITSDTSSLKEVAGNAALLVDPSSVDSIKEGIERILRGSKSFVDKGYKRAQQFSWEKTARQTLDVYLESKNS
jgi:glycosyltransferase involved in cell wall biosynthesis